MIPKLYDFDFWFVPIAVHRAWGGAALGTLQVLRVFGFRIALWSGSGA